MPSHGDGEEACVIEEGKILLVVDRDLTISKAAGTEHITLK